MDTRVRRVGVKERGSEKKRGTHKEKTHQHYMNRICHDSHIRFQDIIVESWGQHSSVLEPCFSIQQKQTIPWTEMIVRLSE